MKNPVGIITEDLSGVPALSKKARKKWRKKKKNFKQSKKSPKIQFKDQRLTAFAE